MNIKIFPSGSFVVPLIGAILIVLGFAYALKGRSKTNSILKGLCLADLGYLGLGLSLATTGYTGALLLLLYNGVARLLAFLSLKNLIQYADESPDKGFLGVAKSSPLNGFLFSLAMFAALGISPFLTPDAKPIILFSAIQANTWALSSFIVASNCVATIFTVIAVHRVWQKGNYEFLPKNWLKELKNKIALPLFLTVLLLIMGILGHLFISFTAGLTGVALKSLPDFSINWHPAVLVLYLGAPIVFLLGLVNSSVRNIIAGALTTLALFLIFKDTSLAPLGRFFGVIASGIGLLVIIYSWRYIQGKADNAYYALLLLMFGSLLGIATAFNLGGLFVFWEIMTLSSYLLVAWEDTEKSHAAALKYFIMCSVAAAIMLPGLLSFHHWYGSMDIAVLSEVIRVSPALPLTTILVLILAGFGVKAGLFPGHSWLPDAHPAAPSSISAPLSGVLTKAGIFGIIQVFLVMMGTGVLASTGKEGVVPPMGWVLSLLGIATMLYGEIMALRQKELKRLLAYSTMGQIGEICMTLGLCTWLATTGALMHVLNHAIMKDLLFLCSGALILRSGSHKLSDLRGLGRAMPLTAACMLIGLISILGLPPFAGFMSKFMMLYALADINPLMAALMLVASLAGVVYYTRIIRTLVFEKYEGAPVQEAPLSMLAPIAVLTALCLIMGLFPHLSLEYLILPVVDGLSSTGKLAVQTMPSLLIVWPKYTILLLFGALIPLLLRKSSKASGKSAALLLALASFMVFMDRGQMDMLSFIFAMGVTLIGCVNMIYSVGYMEHSHTQWRFYAFFLCMTAGLTGVASSKDIFTFFVFWEIMSSWSLYFVIVHEESPLALREGFKYFFFNVLGAAFLFLGVVLIIQWCGGREFSLISAKLPELEIWQVGSFMALMAIGFVMKAAQLPFRIDIQMHPASAPTPVSGYISSVLLKSAIFGLVKLFMVMGGALTLSHVASSLMLAEIMDIIVWVGGATIVMAAIFAVFQTDIKMVLIYSTVSQLGYMVVALALGTSLGISGALLHLVNHIFFKDLLFLVAGAVIFSTHRQSMNDMGGLGLKMPRTLAFFAIGAICVIGLPPSSGFTSKWIIYHALMEQGYVLVALLSLVGSVLTLAYMTKMMHSVFLGQASAGLEDVQEAPKSMTIPMGFMALGCVITSLFPGLILKPLNNVLADLALPQLDVALWGINSGAGAWNATLTAALMASVWLVASLALRRLNRRQRVTEIHTCGIPTEELNSKTNPLDIYGSPSGLLGPRSSRQSSGA